MIEQLVVTRHQGLVQYLIEEGIVSKDVKTVSHATTQDVVGRHVIGVLPYWLSCKAVLFTEIQLRLPKEKIGKDLTLKEVRFYACNPKTYSVKEVKIVRK